MLSNQEIDTGSDWCGNSDESGDCAPAWNPEPTEDNASSASGYNAPDVPPLEPPESTSSPAAPAVTMVTFNDIVEAHGWTILGCFCGPSAANMKAIYVQNLHEILRALRDDGKIPDKIQNKWKFAEGSDAFKIASSELQQYMNAVNNDRMAHIEYMKQFRKKRGIVTFEIFVKTMLGKTMTLEVKSNDTVSDLHCMIESKDGQKRDDSYLEYPKGKTKLTNSRTLADYNIHKGCTVWEMGRLRGGARDEPQDNIESNRNLITLIDRTLVYRLSRIELN